MSLLELGPWVIFFDIFVFKDSVGLMFGFSPTKLLFTAAIIAAVWYGFKWLARVQAEQKERPNKPPKETRKSDAAKGSATDAEYEDLVACSKCGDFVIADKKSGCGKDGCPYDR